MTNATLLIAEDELLIQEWVSSSLNDGGYCTVTVETGDEAIQELDDNHADIAGLITDIRLGDGPSGWDVARHARELEPEMPVVYMTADSAHQWEVNGVPGSLLVQKPFAVAQIINAISSLIVAGSSHPGSNRQ